MVKLDYDRNYYADLEISGTADAVEVKKQFKKLGTLSHLSLVSLLTRPTCSAEMAPRSKPGQGRGGQGTVSSHPGRPRNPNRSRHQSQVRCLPPTDKPVPLGFWGEGQPLAVRRTGRQPEVWRSPQTGAHANSPGRRPRRINTVLGLGAKSPSQAEDGKCPGDCGSMGPVEATTQAKPANRGGCCLGSSSGY